MHEQPASSPLDIATHALAPPDLDPEIAAALAEEEDAGVVKKRLGFGFWFSTGWLVFISGLALLAPLLPLEDPEKIGTGPPYAGFSNEHWLGTDKLGRDMLARVIEGARVSLLIGVGAITAGLLIGGTLGIISGFRRGWFERPAMATMDILLSFPVVVLALSIVTFVGRDLKDIVLALAIVSIAPIARLARANSLVWSQREFVQAARVLGAKNRSLMWREILPNVAMPMASLALIGVAIVTVAEGTLAFLGLGINNRISWGKMVVEGKDSLENAPHVAFVPCAAIFLTVLALNYAGEQIRRLADVRESSL